MALINQSRMETAKDAPKEAAPAVSAEPRTGAYLETLEQIIKRAETHDL